MITAPVHDGTRAAGWLKMSTVGFVLALDQLILPVFHVGEIPIKLAYFLLAAWFVHWLNLPPAARDATTRIEFRDIALLIGGIVLCALLGELRLATKYEVASYQEVMRSVTIYALLVLAFGLGRNTRVFNLRWLAPLLFTAIFLNLIFIFVRGALPGWIIDLYYPPLYIQELALDGIVDARDVLELSRPRGLFGNPNVSALLVNIIALFIHIGIRRRLLAVPGALAGFVIIVGPLLVSALLASRGESVSAAILALVNFQVMMRGWDARTRVRALIVVFATPLLVIGGIGASGAGKELLANLDRVMAVIEILDKPTTADDQADSVARPLLFLEFALSRAVESPIFGTGFSSVDVPPYEYGTQYFHNDWLRLLVTSGVIGVVLMLLLILRFCLPLGWPIVIPFVFPGMVNTFQLNIPGFIFYLFMVGVIRAKLAAGEDWRTA